MRARHLVPTLFAVVALTIASCGADDSDPERAADAATATEDPGSGDPTDQPDSKGDEGSQNGSRDDADDTASADSGESEPDPAAVPESLNFSATTVDGSSFDGASLAGKPTVLWFWAPWCPVCAGQASSVADLAESHGGELNVIGVAGLDEQAAMADFIETNGVGDVTHLSDEDGAVWKRFEVTEQSSFVVLDADGDEQYRQGYRESDELAEHVDELLR